jgi:thiol-disulfide isomerase/thioredoxin
MKTRFFLSLVASLFVASIISAQPDKPAETPQEAPVAPVTAELHSLVDRIMAKLKAGERSEAGLKQELDEFDALLAKYPEKTEGTAQVAMMKAMLYLQVFENEAKGRELLSVVKKEYPGTQPAGMVDAVLDQMTRAEKAKATAANLVGKPAPELHFQWSSAEGVKTLSDLKGKVVILDFWATWCGPCIASFPQIREHVAHFKGSPVAFVGVTSIQGFIANMGERIDTKGDPAKEIALLSQFMKAKEMTWDVAVSTEEVFNPDYGIQGIPFLAIIAPDGTLRFAGLHPGNPEADVDGKIEALLKEFKLPVPAAKG